MSTSSRLGRFRVICDRSGFQCWDDETVIEPVTGLRVLRRFADPVNPLDSPITVRESRPIPDPRPEPADVFIVTPVLPSDL